MEPTDRQFVATSTTLTSRDRQESVLLAPESPRFRSIRARRPARSLAVKERTAQFARTHLNFAPETNELPFNISDYP
jgi:hypothetical protein